MGLGAVHKAQRRSSHRSGARGPRQHPPHQARTAGTRQRLRERPGHCWGSGPGRSLPLHPDPWPWGSLDPPPGCWLLERKFSAQKLPVNKQRNQGRRNTRPPVSDSQHLHPPAVTFRRWDEAGGKRSGACLGLTAWPGAAQVTPGVWPGLREQPSAGATAQVLAGDPSCHPG